MTQTVRTIRKPVKEKQKKRFKEENSNAIEITKIDEDCGVAAIAVHGRTREQYY